MAAKAWTVIDHEQPALKTGDRVWTAAEFPGAPAGCQVQFRTLTSGLSQGVEELRVHNGKLEISILPTRGMGIWKAWLGDWEVGWQSPVRGPVHPQFVPWQEPSGLGWLDGFDEWICRCGLLSNGAPDFDDKGRLAYPLHGRIANRPAQRVEVSVDGDGISVRGIVEETRFHFQKLQLITTITTRFGQARVDVVDEVRNLSGTRAEMQMLYHCNFGAPLLEAGAEVVLAPAEIVPRNPWAAEGIGHWGTFSEPQAGLEERVYFFRLHADSQANTQVLLKNRAGSRGASMHFNVRELPCFSLWKNEAALADGYVTGLEPGTNFPNPRSFEGQQRRVVALEANQSYRMQVGFTLHDSARDVQGAEQAVRQLQGGRETKIHAAPQPTWCAG